MDKNTKEKLETEGRELESHKKLGLGWKKEKDTDGPMFLGEYKHSLDLKGRLALPVKFRSSFKAGIIVTRGLDNCLFVYTKENWAKLAKKISKLPLTKSNARAFARIILAGAMDTKLDKQGRVIIPQYLREYARLRRKTTVAGIYNRLEIWSSGRWSRYKKKSEEDSTKISEELSDLGI